MPALYIGAVHDPMVPQASVLPGLKGAREVLSSGLLSCLWDHQAGHLGFARDWRLPNDFAVEPSAPRGIEAQLMKWLLS